MKYLLCCFALAVCAPVLAQNDSDSKIDTVTILLLPPVNLEEVTVDAIRATKNSGTTYTTVTKEELQKNNLGQDLPYLLDAQPSVVTTSDAGTGIGYTGMRIRGSDQTRINVTVNGVPMNDAENQNVFWVDLPDIASSTQDIQIQRGVGTSTNGAGAFGGSVNLRTSSSQYKPFGDIGMSYGSFNTIKATAKGGSGWLKDKFYIEGRGSYIGSDGYVDRASAKLYSYYVNMQFKHKRTLLKLVNFGGWETTYQSWNGVPQDSLITNRRYNSAGTDFGTYYPPYRNQVDKYMQNYSQLFFTQEIWQHLILNVGAFATIGKGYYEEFKTGQYLPNYEIAPAVNGADTNYLSDLVRRRWLDNVFYGGTYSLNYNHNGLDATLGGMLAQYRGKHFGKVIWARNAGEFDTENNYYYSTGVKEDFNVYGKVNYLFKFGLGLFADLQYRYVNHKVVGDNNDAVTFNETRTFHFFNPKGGVYYNFKKIHQVYASFAMANREPTRDDIIDARITKNEMLQDVEGGYKFMHSRFPLSINGYYMRYKNQLVLTGRLNDVGAAIRAGVPDSYRAGVELAGAFKVWANKPNREVFRINYNFTYSVNKIKEFDEYLYTYDENYSPVDSLTQIITHKNSNISFSPNIIAFLELTGMPVKGLEISINGKFISRQYLDNTSNKARSISPYWYSNINVSYTIATKQKQEIRFTLLFNNIFNNLYETNGYTFSERYSYFDENNNVQVTNPSTYNYYYPQAGFNVLGGVNVRF